MVHRPLGYSPNEKRPERVRGMLVFFCRLLGSDNACTGYMEPAAFLSACTAVAALEKDLSGKQIQASRTQKNTDLDMQNLNLDCPVGNESARTHFPRGPFPPTFEEASIDLRGRCGGRYWTESPIVACRSEAAFSTLPLFLPSGKSGVSSGWIALCVTCL